MDGNLSGLPSLKELLLAQPRDAIDAKQGRQIVNLVRQAKIRPSVANRKVGQLILHPEPFVEGIGWQDFKAGHSLDRSLVRRVRIYLTSRAADEEVPVIRRAAEREFRLLQGIRHPGIAAALDFHDHAWGPALVFEHDPDAVRLDQWLGSRDGSLTVAQKLHLVQDLAEIVDYAHSRRLAHRALRPRAVFVSHPDRPRSNLVVTDWQTGGRLASTQGTRLSSTADRAGLELFFDDDVRRYQAPEAVNPAAAGMKLDVFSLGAIAYRIFAGRPPAATAEELVAAVYDSGLDLRAVVDGLPGQLVELVYDATRGDPAQRIPSVAQFRKRLDNVWEELTAPEPEPVVDPLHAQKGDVLEGGLTVVRRLGTGATATALLVTEQVGDAIQKWVLKVARDQQHDERLAAEARALAGLSHPLVASLVREVRVGNRAALLLENAGERTLAEELREGRLALGLLERYGRDLLRVVYYLEAQGVWHRDLKPANLAARPRASDSQLHLCVFDFSLAATPAGDLAAGTQPYLDPFLGPPRRTRYDAAAERFAAAVTLYEMATGALPTWGVDANPAAVTDEVTLDPAAFDPAVADRLVDFFARALARDARERFDTAEEMEDAWRAVFAELPESVPEPAAEAPGVVLIRESPLEAAGLTPRARSGLERNGIHTVGRLLGLEPSKLNRLPGVPEATRKEIRDRVRALRVMLPPAASPGAEIEVSDQHRAHSIDALAASLLPKRTSRNAAEHDTMRVLLSQVATGEGGFLRWPAQSEVARVTGQGQPQVSTWVRKHIERWRLHEALTQVRDEISALLEARGCVMSARELAEALIAARGSYTGEPKRLPQAIGLVRAAVETELSYGGDARVATHRFRGSDTVLVGREPADPAAVTTAADALAYAVRLGRRAAALAGADPLLTRRRAVERLRAVPVPDGVAVLDDTRLLQVAAEANDAVDLNAKDQLYPVGMPAGRALRLVAGALTGRGLPPEQLQEVVAARFPAAERLPRRPDLDDLLAEAGVDLTWDAAAGGYVSPSTPGSVTSTRVAWSVADNEHVATVAEFPSLSWLAPTPVEAIAGFVNLVRDVVKDMAAVGETVPEPLSERTYSRKFMVRVPTELHRRLVSCAGNPLKI